MPRIYFAESGAVQSELPFFSDWYPTLSDKQKEDLDGWGFFVKELFFSTKKKNGYLLMTNHFKAYVFLSHTVIKKLESPDFPKNLKDCIILVEINPLETHGYSVCIEDKFPCKWEGVPRTSFKCTPTAKDTEEKSKVIIYRLPPLVPSPYSPSATYTNHQEFKRKLKSEANGGQEGTAGVK